MRHCFAVRGSAGSCLAAAFLAQGFQGLLHHPAFLRLQQVRIVKRTFSLGRKPQRRPQTSKQLPGLLELVGRCNHPRVSQVVPQHLGKIPQDLRGQERTAGSRSNRSKAVEARLTRRCKYNR